MCLLRFNFYEKYDLSTHSMIKCTVKKINNLTTTAYAELGAFDYVINGENNGCSLMRDSMGSCGVDSEA